MRAIQIASLDGPQAAKIVEIDEPAADGAVLVDVHAAGVAFPDALQSRGLYQYKPEMPYTPGAEIAGVVRSAPDGAHVSAGDRVCGLTMLCGAMAEVVALQPDGCSNCPTRCRSRRARDCCSTTSPCITRCVRGAGWPTARPSWCTAPQVASARRRCDWRPAWGASRTIAVVSTEDKIAVAKAAGASDVVLADGFKDAVKELTDGRGVDIVVDPVGGDRFTDSLRSLAPGGRLLVIGFTGGAIPEVKVNRLLLNNVDAVGVGWGAWSLDASGLSARAMGRAGAAAGVGQGVGTRTRGLPAGEGGRRDRVAGGPNRQGQGRRQDPVRLLRRRRSVAVRRFDAATGRWVDVDASSAVDLDGLTVATFNIWFDSHHAEQRYLAIAEILGELAPDVVALQEVTPAALDIFLEPAVGARMNICMRPWSAAISATTEC